MASRVLQKVDQIGVNISWRSREACAWRSSGCNRAFDTKTRCSSPRTIHVFLSILVENLFVSRPVSDPEQIEDVKILAEYVALIHAPYFLQSPLAVSAPRQDRDFWIDIHNYKKCFKEGDVEYDMLEAVLRIMQMNHLWYLTEELVIFALFDDNLDDGERKSMAHNLLSTPRPIQFKPGENKLISI